MEDNEETKPKKVNLGALQNLIPVTMRTKEEAREISRKGGQSKSPLKSISAKLRCMKQMGKIDDEMHQKLHDMMLSDEATSFENLKYIIATANIAKNVKDRERIARLLLEWQKIHHGIKGRIDINQTSFERREVDVRVQHVGWEELLQKIREHKEDGAKKRKTKK